MTKQEILRELQDINIDAANYIYTENYDALNSLVNSVFKIGLDKEECFYDFSNSDSSTKPISSSLVCILLTI